MKHICIIITPFIWHRPTVDRFIEADPIYRCGPFSVSGLPWWLVDR